MTDQVGTPAASQPPTAPPADTADTADSSDGTTQDLPSTTSLTPESYEAQHVHSVYQSIAPHFSATRHKPWPFITSFLESLAPGSVGLDVGCGNGKYLPVNPSLHILASDRSPNLLACAQQQFSRRADADAALDDPPAPPSALRQLAVADTLSLPYRPGSVDFVICIAVLHHLSTRERRREAVEKLLACARPGGQVLVYVWALEQSTSRRGWGEGSDQDRMVSWVMRGKGKKGKKKEDVTYQRYYHLYKEGELEEDVVAAGGEVLRSGYERDNWWSICTRRTRQ